MRIAFVGCGYVADSYIATFPDHPELELVGVHDRDEKREADFASFHSLKRYRALKQILEDATVDAVINLTNPASHYEVTKACLLAGKHVYSEKPLAMTFSQAAELVALANEEGLHLSGAPCTLLGEPAQTLWRALRNEEIGRVRLVYAEIDDGPVDLMGHENMKSISGAPWPYQDEFQVGCTLEHAGYYLSWLCAFFGPVETVTAFSSCLKPSKLSMDIATPDFSVACIRLRSGVIARLTNGIYAPHNHRFQIIGDEGRLYVDNAWHFGAQVYIERHSQLSLKAAGHPITRVPFAKTVLGVKPKKYPAVRRTSIKYATSKYYIDFARGISEFASAIEENRVSRISPSLLLHINEVILGIQAATESGASFEVRSDFDPITPMPWAQ
jgi:predicted dehydrogenase